MIGVTNDPIFNSSEQHLHKDGLWTRPAAEYPPEDHCKQGYEDNKDEHTQAENKEVLRPEDHAEYDELTFQHIQHEQWFIIYLDKREGEKYNKVKSAEPGS